MATYYIKTNGDDTKSGLSDALAWKTISKVNSVTLNAGDTILFNRGDVFYGTITASKSGTSSNRITYGAYGSGDNPKISGLTTLSSWTNEGGGIYSSSVSSVAQTNIVTVDGVQVAMGRYPNAGTNLIYESHSGVTSITDNQMTASPNWTGAELVLNGSDWTIDRCSISNHSGTTFTFTNLGSGDEPQNNRWYFIQNDIRCVTEENEWYHDTSSGKLYVYGDPSAKTIKIATINYLFNFNTKNYITIDGIDFEGSIVHNIYMPYGSSYCYVKNCNISFAGRRGISIDGENHCLIDNNVITNCNEAAIYGYSDNSYLTITDNKISNIGLLPGQAYFGTQSVGIYGYGLSDTLIQHNRIENTAYNGIYFVGTNVDIYNNFIDYPMQLLDDGGGIYTNGSNTGRVIDGNIILHSGVNGFDNNLCAGIYNDSGGDNLIVTNNTIAHCATEGIKNNLGSNNTYSGNTLYDNLYGLYITEWYSSYGNVTDLDIQNNIIVAKENTQRTLYIYFDANNISSMGTSDGNCFARPIDDNQTIRTYQPSTGYVNRTLSTWQSFSGLDGSSVKSPISIDSTTKLHFYYNATKTTSSEVLSTPMIDMFGEKYSDEITLSPYTSIILMDDPNPPTTTLAPTTSTTTSVPTTTTTSTVVSTTTTQLPTTTTTTTTYLTTTTTTRRRTTTTTTTRRPITTTTTTRRIITTTTTTTKKKRLWPFGGWFHF